MTLARFSVGLCIGAVALAWQPTAYAVSTAAHVGVGAEFSDVVASADTDYRTRANSTSGRAALRWQPDDLGACGFGDASRMVFKGFDMNGRGKNGFTEFGSPFALGNLKFWNHTGIGDPGVSSANLNVSLYFGNQQPVADFVFGLTLSEVPGTGNKPKKSYDLLTLTSAQSSVNFTFEGQNYKLDILGWSQDRGASFIDSLLVKNDHMGKAKLFGVISPLGGVIPDPTAVPVPAAVWLFGSGLVGLVAFARRRTAS